MKLARRRELFPGLFDEAWTSPLRDIQETMNRMFDSVFGEGRALAASLWHPSLDMYLEKDSVVVEMALPGLTRDEIEIHVVGDSLTVKGESRREAEGKEKDYYHRELVRGSFSRTMALPCEVQPEKVKATFKDGILRILLPQKEEAKAKSVKISVE